MGLDGGPNGAKALFKEQFQSAFRQFSDLAAARNAVGVSRNQTLVVVDGNVLVMQTPASVDTFDAYVAILAGQLGNAIQAGEHVVVVFDEPAAMTRAKLEEQNARDARRSVKTPVCSEDLSAIPMNDDYTRADLEAPAMNVKLLMNHRQARSRFYDGLCVATMGYLQKNMTGTGQWSLTFDGVDARGADRPVGEKRKVGILSTHPELWEPVLHRSAAIGEGDLKLTDVCTRVHTAPRASRAPMDVSDAQEVVVVPRVHGVDVTPIEDVLLNILWTIDTDSFLIELMQQARRECRPNAEDRNELTLLCLREPSRKRKGEAGTDPAYFNCIDMQVFYRKVMSYMFGSESVDKETESKKRLTAALMAASIALCGCDFVQVQGLRADLILPCVRNVARNRPNLLKLMNGAFTGRAEDTRNAGDAIRAVVDDYVENLAGAPRMAKSKQNASNYNDLQILRACWITAYWLGYEFKDVRQWGWPASQSVED